MWESNRCAWRNKTTHTIVPEAIFPKETATAVFVPIARIQQQKTTNTNKETTIKQTNRKRDRERLCESDQTCKKEGKGNDERRDAPFASSWKPPPLPSSKQPQRHSRPPHINTRNINQPQCQLTKRKKKGGGESRWWMAAKGRTSEQKHQQQPHVFQPKTIIPFKQ